MLIGPDATLAEHERALIEPALTRVIDRASPEALERLSAISDPVMIAVGVGLWGMRVLSTRLPKEPKRRTEKRSPEQPVFVQEDENASIVVPPPPSIANVINGGERRPWG